MKTLEEVIIEKNWQTKKGKVLKAKPLVKKLRNIVGAMGVVVAMEKEKVTGSWKGPLGSGVTRIGSQVHNQASTWIQFSVQIGSQSYPQKSPAASSLPSRKRAPGTKADVAPRSKKTSCYPRRNCPLAWRRRCLSFLRPLALEK